MCIQSMHLFLHVNHFFRKRNHKGTSEAPVLPSSKHSRCSKDISMGRRQAQAVPVATFCGRMIVFINTFCPITLVLSAPYACCSLLFFPLQFDCPNVSLPFSATYSLHLIHTHCFRRLPVFVSIFRLLLLLFIFPL